MNTCHRLFVGDARMVMQDLPNQSVQLVVTSPPYWKIKDYEHQSQIGFHQSYEEYISSLKEVWAESKRLLSPGCKLVVNVGDQFLRANENGGKYEIVPIHMDIIQSCKMLGFTFLGNIIWQKITTTNTSGGCSWMGSIYFPRDGYITYEHEYILIFKKPGKAPKPSVEMKSNSRLPKEFRSKWFRGIWSDLPPARQKDHVAMFPLELPERIIRMFSFYGETVIDPFVGSGTTMEAAKMWGRSSIGIELNPAHVPLVNKRMKNLEVIESNMKKTALELRKVI